jgi:hypothetical protein
MRPLFFILVALNLLFLAWTQWINASRPKAQITQPANPLPSLTLVSELPASKQRTPAPAAVRLSALDDAVQPRVSCVSVGPFESVGRMINAVSLLREKGFTPQGRAVPTQVQDGYWVFIKGLATEAQQTEVMGKLTQAGISDARLMPAAAGERRVSVGIFRDRNRAKQRVKTLQRLGLNPQIGDWRVPGEVYWVDVSLKPEQTSISAEGLLRTGNVGSRFEVRNCSKSSVVSRQSQRG